MKANNSNIVLYRRAEVPLLLANDAPRVEVILLFHYLKTLQESKLLKQC